MKRLRLFGIAFLVVVLSIGIIGVMKRMVVLLR